MNRNEKIALIDGDSLIYYEMGKPTLEEALAGIDSRIQQMLEIAEAEKYAGTLGYNYPSSYWYKASYQLINKELKSN